MKPEITDTLDFDRAISDVLESEGVFSNDARDNGGMTKYGISKRAHPSVDIANLTKDRAIEIYRHEYWYSTFCQNWAGPICLAVFDCAVNQGVGFAIRNLQITSGTKPDGRIGPKTIAAVKGISRMEFLDWLQRFQGARISRYIISPDWQTYGNGWMRRVNRNTIRAMLLWHDNPKAFEQV